MQRRDQQCQRRGPSLDRPETTGEFGKPGRHLLDPEDWQRPGTFGPRRCRMVRSTRDTARGRDDGSSGWPATPPSSSRRRFIPFPARREAFGPGWFATKARAARRLIQGVARLRTLLGASTPILRLFGPSLAGSHLGRGTKVPGWPASSNRRMEGASGGGQRVGEMTDDRGPNGLAHAVPLAVFAAETKGGLWTDPARLSQ